LKNDVNKAIPLIESAISPAYYDYKVPSIIFQTTIQKHEPMFQESDHFIFKDIRYSRTYLGLSIDMIRPKMNSLIPFISLIAEIAKNYEKGQFPFHLLDKTGEITLNQHDYLKIVQKNKEQITFEVSYNNRRNTVDIHGEPNTGQWLEEIVATAFLHAGGKNISDLRVGIKWPWNYKKSNDKDAFQTEIDIVMIWKENYVCISCKLALKIKKLSKICSEIIAETRAGFGRFALPVLVRGGIPHSSAKDHAESTMKNDPMEISLCLLNQPDKLINLLDKALAQKRTVKQAK
jgi:hypothetical protein